MTVPGDKEWAVEVFDGDVFEKLMNGRPGARSTLTTVTRLWLKLGSAER
jgi:hypothetical protein